jgi:hypothetical protein
VSVKDAMAILAERHPEGRVALWRHDTPESMFVLTDAQGRSNAAVVDEFPSYLRVYGDAWLDHIENDRVVSRNLAGSALIRSTFANFSSDVDPALLAQGLEHVLAQASEWNLP